MSLPNSVFVDTSFFIALLNSSDTDHTRALELQLQLSEANPRKVTSEYVLMELGDGLSRLRFRPLAIKLLALVHADPSFEIVASSTEWFARAVALFQNRADKDWGLTDCSSFAIMHHMGIVAALTADRHFQQAGYVALLLEQEL
ncbi:MAG: type II toxin-antitoxin system VapC family toxin [Caldilineaceae bacterium]|nr:type II toxin-antitoxin system VapC family toxin [Caldilineaceae bacterium]